MALVELDVTDHIAVVTLNRPEALNAISGAMADELRETFEKVSADDDVWVVVLRAAGERAFCVGADLKERGGFTLEDFYKNRQQIKGLFAVLRGVPQPVIAAPFGFALGGGFELVLSSDIVVAAEGTKLGLPETRVGLLPAGGGTQLLTRKVGVARAKELIFRARQIDASEAQQIGIVNDIAKREDLDDWVMQVARQICGGSPVAIREAKRSIDAALGVPVDDGIEVEHESWERVITSDDRLEGIAAFNEKRDPQWKNK
ncbi:MAG: enoyl-CoA hydratase/isomerase family protein [Actinomycetota bacterium]